MRIQVEHHADLRAAPRSLYRGERRIDIIEIMDQWYGPGYRYVKVRGHDSSVSILLFDEIRDQWEPLRPHFENGVVLTRVITLRPKSSRVEI
jgi:hypothetical protein